MDIKILYDDNACMVNFSFEKNAFTKTTNHVFIICSYHGKWLLTNHKTRGMEFPGGKVEKGETLEEAAIREVYEETGGIVKELVWIAEYEVIQNDNSFVKAVYFANIVSLEKKEDYYETNGPVMVNDDLLLPFRFGDSYSFIMKDDVVKLCIEKIKEALIGDDLGYDTKN